MTNLDYNLLNDIETLLIKKGYMSPQDMGMGMGQPMDPSMMQGMPQGMPPGMPMDPSMMQGIPQGMPPGMMQGMPQGMPPGMPMDPSMMMGMDPSMMQQGPPEEDPLVKQMENFDGRLKNLEEKTKLILDKIEILISEVNFPKSGSDNSSKKNVLSAIKQLLSNGE